jgi:hypothetical protein
MPNPRRKLWTRREPRTSSEQSQEQVSAGGDNSRKAVERLSQYSAREEQSVAEGNEEAVDTPSTVEEPASTEAEAADLSAVGDEVGTVLRSAQEAAAKIRRAARAEAAKRREEVEASAATELAEARRVADAARAEAHRVRAEADAYAKDTRAAADAFAEQRQQEAERAAGEIVADAERRLRAADAEVERKVREAQATARERVDLLKAEAGRYEERLENIFVVFREMSSQLEELLGRPQIESGDGAEAFDESLEDALRPESSSSRAG